MLLQQRDYVVSYQFVQCQLIVLSSDTSVSYFGSVAWLQSFLRLPMRVESEYMWDAYEFYAKLYCRPYDIEIHGRCVSP